MYDVYFALVRSDLVERLRPYIAEPDALTLAIDLLMRELTAPPKPLATDGRGTVYARRSDFPPLTKILFDSRDVKPGTRIDFDVFPLYVQRFLTACGVQADQTVEFLPDLPVTAN